MKAEAKRKLVVLATSSVLIGVSMAEASTLTFNGASSASNTNTTGNGTYNYGSPYGFAGALTTYDLSASLGGTYNAGDDLVFDGSVSGSTFNLLVSSALFSGGNANSLTFNDAGGAGKTYIFTRASTSTTAGSSGTSLGFVNTTGTNQGADSYNSTTPFGATVAPSGSTSMLLDTGFTGRVVLRSRASGTATGTTTIRSGTLEIADGGALLTNGSSNNNPGTVTLAGGTLAININTGNVETAEGAVGASSAQLGGTLAVTANSTLKNTAINFDGTSRRQDLWGGSGTSPVNIDPGVTLSIDTGVGATIKQAITRNGTSGIPVVSQVSPNGGYLRLNVATGGGAGNVQFNLGSNSSSLDLAATGTYNIGHLTGGSATNIRGGTGGIAVVQLGNLGQAITYGGTIHNGFGSSNGGGPAAVTNTVFHTSVSKVGTNNLTLSGSNRYSGTTTVTGGTLTQGSAKAFGQSASAVTANAGGTIDLNGINPYAGRSYVLGGGSLVNNGSSAVTLHTGLAGNVNSGASGAIFGAGTDTGSPSSTTSWKMNGGTTPVVNISGGGGSGASGTLYMQVGWMRLNAPSGLGTTGSGYLKAPTITFDAPSDPNGRTAKAFVQIGQPGTATAGTITGIQIVDPGWGYTSVPNLTIDNTGTGGSGFRPIFAMAGNFIDFTSVGSGYTSAPTITVSTLGTVSGYTGATPPVPTAPVNTGGFSNITLTDSTSSNIGGSGDLNINVPIVRGPIVGTPGNLSKIGTGTTTLANANSTYSGSTTVSQGQLTLANTASITATSSVTVNSSATLRNDGTLTSIGAVTVNAGGKVQGTGTFNANTSIAGTLQPGNSVGKLTWATGTLTLAPGSTSNFEIAGAEGAANAGITYDNVKVTSGALSYDGTLNIDFASVPTAPATYDLFDLGVAPTGNFASVNLTNAVVGNLGTPVAGVFSAVFGGISYTFTSSTGDLVLAVNAVPEPLTAAGVILLAGRVLGRRSRESI